MMDRISAYRELIRKNIDYENYPPIYNKQEVDELIELIVNPNAAAGCRNNSDWRKGTSCSDCKKHVPEAG